MQFGSSAGLARCAAAAAACVSTGSHAAEFSVQPLFDLRLRYELVDQDGIPNEADALTLRSRPGLELSAGPWRLLAEAEGTAPLTERYDSGLNGRSRYPLVGDPEDIELNRLQVQYRGIPKTELTGGRQLINVDDQRFVGAVGWRQNEQTFDAVRLEHGDGKGLKLDLAYAWSARTIWGAHGRGARQTAIGGDNFLATISHPTPLGTLGGFLFVVDQDEEVVSLFRQSSGTLGAKLAGRQSLSPKARLSYVLSYARQRDSGRNPGRYGAAYSLAELTLELGPAHFGLGHEVLGADGGRPFTSFQTPLATLHKFQGWADKFTVTPPNGVRDLYASGGYGWERIAGLDALAAQLVWHRFRSDRLGLDYGSEWDALLSGRKGRWAVTAKLADYDADTFATDTRKAWLQLEWAL